MEEHVEVHLTAELAVRPGPLPNGSNGFQPMSDPPVGCKSSLKTVAATGACWFRDESARACAIHRNHGERSLPSACRQFPRVAVLEPGAVAISLSHYCPTAAGLLFDEAPDFGLVQAPLAFPPDWPFEGLDVREAYSPLLRPGVLLGFDGLQAFEDGAIALLSRAPLWTALAALRTTTESIRSWDVKAGPLHDFVARRFIEAAERPGGSSAADPRPTLVASLTEGTQVRVGLPEFRPDPPLVPGPVDLALRKYLAARLVASWVMFQGSDLRTVVRYLGLCLDTVCLFASAQEPGEPDSTRWAEAIRNADLWILHYCDPERLARNLR
ncbi:MAG: hypothetical protein K1Y01_19705 [Vicinamibacteria bacterium]|nr:hypothetical protein [Vicinamibacteria bacterium]